MHMLTGLCDWGQPSIQEWLLQKANYGTWEWQKAVHIIPKTDKGCCLLHGSVTESQKRQQVSTSSFSIFCGLLAWMAYLEPLQSPNSLKPLPDHSHSLPP